MIIKSKFVKSRVGQTLPTALSPTFSSNLHLPRHRWYHFKEGFSAGLVESFVGSYMPSKGKLKLLDPFLGSGTTAVEAGRLGVDVHGIETNPFMAFLAKVKTGDYSRSCNLEALAFQSLKNRVRDKHSILPTYTTLVERPGLAKWLLNRTVARRFEQLHSGICNVRPTVVRDLLLLALMSSVVEVANARKDGKCWRYKRHWQNLSFDGKDLEEAFAAQVIRFAEDVRKCPKLDGKISITRGDSRASTAHGPNPVLFDGMLTSPPYLNSFDYTDIYRPELLLLKQIQSPQELRELRYSTLRSHVQVNWTASAPLQIPLLRRRINQIKGEGLWCDRIPEMINAYFVDLDCVVKQCASRLKNGAIAGFVVADSAYLGVVIPVNRILSQILERRGFRGIHSTFYRETPGNGNHQSRSGEKLQEVMVLGEYGGN